jgi:mono/diheme cytochrome c family protein
MTGSQELLRALQAMVVCSALDPAAHGQTRAAVARGQEIAERACAGCHAINGGQQGSTIQGTQVPSFTSLASRPYWAAESLQTSIMTPKHPMPAMPLQLADVNDLVAYIRSLR